MGVMLRLLLVVLVLSLLSLPQPAVGAILRGDLSEAQQDRIEQLVAHLSPEEKIGQLLMVGFLGDSQADQLALAKTLIQDYHVGGIILFSRNFTTDTELPVPENVARLNNTLQDYAAARRQTRIPLLIATDQENGAVLQIKKGVTILPSAMALGATRNEEYAFQAGRITGSELSLLGINMVLAPVADVHNNGDNDIIGTRSFGSDIELVERMSLQFMRGLQQGGVLSVAKHFPGHGGTDEDPHDTLPLVIYDRDTIMHKAKPFYTLASEGVNALMTTHMEFEKLYLGKDMPISLSRKGVSELIREKMHFSRVVLPDDLSEMEAVRLTRHSGDAAQQRSYEEVARMAVEATSDLLIFAHITPTATDKRRFTLVEFDRVINELKSYFASHPTQLDTSVARILALKLRISEQLKDPLLWKTRPSNDYPALLSKLQQMQEANHQALSVAMTDAAILLVNDEFDLFSPQKGPLSEIGYNDRIVVVAPVYTRNDLAPLITQHYGNVDSYNLNYGKWQSKPITRSGDNSIAVPIEDLAAAMSQAKLVIFGLIKREQAFILETLVEMLRQQGKKVPLVAIAYHEPNLLDYHLIRNISYLAAFSNSLAANESVYRALRGEIAPNGRKYLPVTIPQIFPDFRSSAEIVPRQADLVTVATAANAGGGISPDRSQKVLKGQKMSFHLVPDAGYRLVEVTGCAGDLRELTYTTSPLEDDCTVKATFEKISVGALPPEEREHSRDDSFHATFQAIFVILVILVCLGAFMWFLKKFVFPEPDLKREALIFLAMLVIIIVSLLVLKQISPELFAKLFGQIVDKSP